MSEKICTSHFSEKMCTLLRAFFRDANKMKAIVAAKTFVWNASEENPVLKIRSDVQTFYGVENFSCEQEENRIKVLFTCSDNGAIATIEKTFPLRLSYRGELMLPFSDRTSGEISVRDRHSFDGPMVDHIFCRTLLLSTTADSQFWENFCFTYDVPLEKASEGVDVPPTFVKSQHLRSENFEVKN